MVKREVKPEEPDELLATTPTYRAPIPRMRLWPTNTPSSSMADWEPAGYATPTARRVVPNFSQTPFNTRLVNFQRLLCYGRWHVYIRLDSPFRLDPDTYDDDQRWVIYPNPLPYLLHCNRPLGRSNFNASNIRTSEKITDCLKLKGVKWPGMDLFDSATPEMKRIRNQRKDVSVLEQMKETSLAVRPTEFVYNLDVEFQKTRDIFGPLSCENSPVS